MDYRFLWLCISRLIFANISDFKPCELFNRTELTAVWNLNNSKSRVFCDQLCLEMATCPGYEFAQTCKLKNTAYRVQAADKMTTAAYAPIPSTGLEYKLHDSRLGWFDAGQVCKEEGAALIEPHSRKPFGPFFEQILSTLPKDKQCAWIGLSDKFDNDTWYWGSGKRVDGQGMWDYNEPHNIDSKNRKENCAAMALAHKMFLSYSCWGDHYCGRKLHFVCARKRRP